MRRGNRASVRSRFELTQIACGPNGLMPHFPAGLDTQAETRRFLRRDSRLTLSGARRVTRASAIGPRGRERGNGDELSRGTPKPSF